MSDAIIKVENLGKKYIIGHQQQGSSNYVALRDVIADGAKSLMKSFQMLKSPIPKNTEEFWALKDVSFEVKQGECIGIIGRNGAGKSTLLKILSRITEPTTGRIEIGGRVASLLEVGTGFHPELTGRENIYLNGAILGMSREEIKRKFDEIVAFAEVEKFLDTPVKRYSSGMYVRLAFAVAAHLEPEILIVDEVLAVGDAAFQKKCLGKMGDVATKEGRTVLFVSHNMGTIQKLCQRCLLLNQGKLIKQGKAETVVKMYFQENDCSSQTSTTSLNLHQGRKSIKQAILKKIEIFSDNFPTTTLRMGGNLKLIVLFQSEVPISNLRFGISIEDYTGQRILALTPSFQSPELFKDKIYKEGKIICEVPTLCLVAGLYYITLIIGNGHSDLDYIERAVELKVEPYDVFDTGYVPESQHGFFYQDAKWLLDSLN